MSDTPRTDAAAFGTDNETLNRLFWIRELPRYVVPADFARQLERELAAVTAERNDEIEKSLDLSLKCERITADLSASQQEARRLREALEKYRDALSDGPENCPFSKYEQVDEIARESLASTPAPVHKDTERLNFCDTMIDLAPGFYVLRFPVTESCTIRDAIDAELARND